MMPPVAPQNIRKIGAILMVFLVYKQHIPRDVAMRIVGAYLVSELGRQRAYSRWMSLNNYEHALLQSAPGLEMVCGPGF